MAKWICLIIILLIPLLGCEKLFEDKVSEDIFSAQRPPYKQQKPTSFDDSVYFAEKATHHLKLLAGTFAIALDLPEKFLPPFPGKCVIQRELPSNSIEFKWNSCESEHLKGGSGYFKGLISGKQVLKEFKSDKPSSGIFEFSFKTGENKNEFYQSWLINKSEKISDREIYIDEIEITTNHESRAKKNKYQTVVIKGLVLNFKDLLNPVIDFTEISVIQEKNSDVSTLDLILRRDPDSKLIYSLEDKHIFGNVFFAYSSTEDELPDLFENRITFTKEKIHTVYKRGTQKTNINRPWACSAGTCFLIH